MSGFHDHLVALTNSVHSFQIFRRDVSRQIPRSKGLVSEFKWAMTGVMLTALLGATGVSRAAGTTSASLSVTSVGIATTSVAVGTAVTLTATLVSNGTAVHPGTVRFCDLTASPTCSEVSLLGTAQLTAAGTASLTLRLGVGAHSLKAVFLGTGAFAGSQSASQPLTVTGLYPSATTLRSAPESIPGVYDLTATVYGLGPATGPFPTGPISFQDAAQPNQQLASASLGAGTTSRAFDLANVWTGTSPLLGMSTVGDFNRDGKPDLVVCDPPDNLLWVFPGNGDGSFGTAASYPVGNIPGFVAVADVNNDGKLDLIVTNQTDNTVSVLLGNGDGTFQKQRTYPTDKQPVALAVGDLNGDGNLDLVVAVQPGALSVMLGNGDGTFQAFQSYQIFGILGLLRPTGVIIGDFNGDGKPDVAASTLGDYNAFDNIAVLLGNGDGTLQAPSFYSMSQYGGQPSSSIGMGDFNGDGKIDLAITNVADGFTAIWNSSVSVMLGNGDGTFQPQVLYAMPDYSFPRSIQVADFDGDGNQDLAMATEGDNHVSTTPGYQVAILFGKGDGTFNTPRFFDLGPQSFSNASSVTAADLNGDGHPDIVAFQAVESATQGSVVSFLSSDLSASVTAAGVSIPGITVQTIKASYSGDSIYSPSLSSGISLSAIGSAPLTWATPAPIVYGAALGTTQLNATSTVSGTFVYSPVAGTILPVGVQTLSVTFTPADTSQYTTASTTVLLTVTPAPLTVSASNAARVFGAPNPTFTGTIAGAVNGDSFTETFTTPAAMSSIVGSYTITPAVSGSALGNYQVSTVNGTLTITQSGTSTAFALANNNLTLTATVSSLTSGTPTGSVNFLSGQTLIGNAPLMNGSATFTASAAPAGNSVITAQYSGDANFTQSASPTVPVINLAAASSSLTVSPNGSVSDILTVTPDAGLVGTLQASCNGVPAMTNCTLQPSSVTFSGTNSPTTVTLTIRTGSNATATLQPVELRRNRNPLMIATVALWLPGCLTSLLACDSKKKRRYRAKFLVWLLILGGLTTMSSCGGSSKGTPAGTSTVQVTVTDGGSLTQTVNLSLNVQ